VSKSAPDLITRLRERAKKNVLNRGPKCTVCLLPAETLEALRQLKADGFGFSVIARTLAEAGLATVSANTISRHYLDHEASR
jgi:hypothetical protein